MDYLPRDVIESAPTGFAYLLARKEKDDRITDLALLTVNRSFERLTSEKEIEGKSLFAVLPELKEECLSRAQGRRGMSVDAVTGRFELYSKRMGKWLRILAEKIDDEHFVAWVSDISVEKTIEGEDIVKADGNSENMSSERLYRLLAENSTDIVALIRDDIVEYVSPAVKKILGYTPAELNNITFDELIAMVHPQDRERVRRGILKAYQDQRELMNYRLRMRRKNGEYVWLENHSRLFYDEKGRHTHTFLNSRDVSKRVKAEQELKEHEEFLRKINENVDYTIYVLDVSKKPDGGYGYRFKYVNPNFEKRLGISLKEIAGKEIEVVSHLFDIEWIRERYYDCCVEAKKPLSYIEERVRSGKTIWLQSNLSPVMDENGEVYRLVGASIEITEIKHTQEQLRQEKERAKRLSDKYKEANRVKRDFLNNMGHELRTPLNGILGFSQILGESGLTENQGEFLDYIQISGERMLRVVNDILKYIEIKDKTYTIKRSRTNLSELLDAVMQESKRLAGKKGLHLELIRARALPDDIITASSQLKKVLMCLMDNGIKFTREGTVTLEVRPVNIGADSAKIRFSVSDTGIGIEKEKQKVIFDSFTQADSSSSRGFDGNGLGLAIAQEIIKRENSRLSVTSKPGKGSTFSFVLQVGLQEKAEDPLTEKPATTEIRETEI